MLLGYTYTHIHTHTQTWWNLNTTEINMLEKTQFTEQRSILACIAKNKLLIGKVLIIIFKCNILTLL